MTLMDNNESIIQLEHVSRRYGRKLALDDVSLDVPRGRIFGLVGPNGAGKTTVIKHILGLLRAQKGSVRVLCWTRYVIRARSWAGLATYRKTGICHRG